ncbi:hypothetical protein ADUPG1_013937 [Aduncisulcus paluster]|uniref:OTU domain-containing protein n=1 Tax=Aduncisulcus paluster TaxID=2918883 RepID=A0ABQ5K8Y4_9EUKA|nr:hypothetical protein ADUPG1_013937 [Aduncisulcus paluster]
MTELPSILTLAPPKDESKGKMQQRHKMEVRSLDLLIKKHIKENKKRKAEAKKETQEWIDILANKHSAEIGDIQSSIEPVEQEKIEAEPIELKEKSKEPKLSKAERKRRKKWAKEKALQDEIDAERHEQALRGGSMRTRENKDIFERLEKDGLSMRIVEVGSDGNCLFNAIVDQIHYLQGKGDTVQEFTALELRKLACDEIESDDTTFSSFYLADEKTKEEYLEEMRKESKWGGFAECIALSRVLKTKLIVHTAFSFPQILGEEFEGRTMHISFHQHWFASGAHYNSLRFLD